MSGEEKGFAERWSKRKSAAREDEDQEAVADEDVLALSENQNESDLDDVNDTQELTEEDFEDVDFEALDKSSDYTRFVKANVPAAIQQKALRKLWDSDSVFEVLDGMNDYDEDFTGDGLAGKAFKTAYKVGRGFLDAEEDDDDDDVDVAETETKDQPSDAPSDAIEVNTSTDSDENAQGSTENDTPEVEAKEI